MMLRFRRTPVMLSVCGWDRGHFAAKSPTGKPRWAWAMDVSSQTGWIGVIQVIAVLEDEAGVVSADTLTRHLGLAPGGARTTLVSRGTLEGPGHPRNFSPPVHHLDRCRLLARSDATEPQWLLRHPAAS